MPFQSNAAPAEQQLHSGSDSKQRLWATTTSRQFKMDLPDAHPLLQDNAACSQRPPL